MGLTPLLPALLLASSLTAGPDARSHPLPPAEQAALLAAREALWRAWFADDEALLNEVLPADVLAINNGDERWQGRAEILADARAFKQAGGRLRELRFPRTEVQSFGDVAVLYSLFALETEKEGRRARSSGRATEVFVRRDGRWVNPGWHLDSGR